MDSMRISTTINSKMSRYKMRKRRSKRKRKRVKNKLKLINKKMISLRSKSKKQNKNQRKNCNSLLKIRMIKRRFFIVVRNRKKQNSLREIRKSSNLWEIHWFISSWLKTIASKTFVTISIAAKWNNSQSLTSWICSTANLSFFMMSKSN